MTNKKSEGNTQNHSVQGAEKFDRKKPTKTTLYQDKLRMPPNNIEAEISTLGSLMVDENAITKVADIIHPDDFYKDKHGKIYEAILDLYQEQEPLDILSVSSKLKDQKLLKEVGGRVYLTELINAVPSASNVVSYANLVRKKSVLRNLIKTASEIVEMGYSEDRPIDEILDKAEKNLFSVGQKSLKQDFSQIDSLLEDAFVRIDEMHKNSDKFRGIATGFTDLDGLLSGLQKSDLIILAARPSVGKTSFALNLAINAAVKDKASVGIFSLEMSSDQLVDRMLSTQSGVNLWELRTGNISRDSEEDDFQKIGEAMGVLSEAPIHIDDSATANIMEMRTMARRLQAEKGLDLLIIDYLQLMEGRGRSSENRVQEISEISRGLKTLAKELNVPIIALSQLSRAVENRSPQIPKLSDLRESGSIEQDADVTMFLYREERENPNTENKNVCDIIVAKHRNGPVGTVPLFFDDKTTGFRDLEKYKSEN